MKSLHLFAGIGGGMLGDLLLGHQPIAAVWDVLSIEERGPYLA